MSEECDTGEGDYSDPASTDTDADGCLDCAVVDGWFCEENVPNGLSTCNPICGDGLI